LSTQILGLYKQLTSPEIPEGSWLWFIDADAIISNMKIHVLDHVQSAPSFLAQFSEYKGGDAANPSLYMGVHSVAPWELEVSVIEAPIPFLRS
jgi:hypothetical protein